MGLPDDTGNCMKIDERHRWTWYGKTQWTRLEPRLFGIWRISTLSARSHAQERPHFALAWECSLDALRRAWDAESGCTTRSLGTILENFCIFAEFAMAKKPKAATLHQRPALVQRRGDLPGTRQILFRLQ